MGRRLRGIVASAGCFEGTVHARVLVNTAFSPPWYGHARARDFGSLVRHGLLGADEYERFITEQERLHAEGRYFYAITGCAYVGRRRG